MQVRSGQEVAAKRSRALARAWTTAMLLAATPAGAEPQRPASSDTGPSATADRPDETSAASGFDNLASRFSFRGFGTLGLVYSNAEDADFVGDLFQPNGAGHNRPVDFGPDSKIGAQADVRITDSLSAVVQIVSRHRYDNRYWPQLEWANLRYQITPDLSVRVGRTVAALFMVSESRLVGFANPWVRPPVELYGLGSATNRDGIDGSYRFRVRRFTNTIQAGYGATTVQLPKGSEGGSVDAKHFFEISNTIEHGPFTLRIGYWYARLDVKSNVDTLFDSYAQFGGALAGIPGLELQSAQALRVADRYEFDDVPLSTFTIGGSYDSGKLLAMAEFARQNGPEGLGDSTAWYVTGGYRVGPLTPYLTYAQLRADHRFDEGVSAAGLPPQLSPVAGALNAGLDGALASLGPSQRSVAVGVRWDFVRNAALKLQYEHIDLRSGSSGRLGNGQPDLEPGGRVDAVSLAIDFVF